MRRSGGVGTGWELTAPIVSRPGLVRPGAHACMPECGGLRFRPPDGVEKHGKERELA
jgi:hypothetical protein